MTTAVLILFSMFFSLIFFSLGMNDIGMTKDANKFKNIKDWTKGEVLLSPLVALGWFGGAMWGVGAFILYGIFKIFVNKYTMPYWTKLGAFLDEPLVTSKE